MILREIAGFSSETGNIQGDPGTFYNSTEKCSYYLPTIETYQRNIGRSPIHQVRKIQVVLDYNPKYEFMFMLINF